MKSGDPIGDFLERNALGTMRMFAAGPCAELSEKAIERRLSRGIQDGRCVAFRLYGTTKYYTLTREAARERNIFDDGAGFAFGFQALAIHYAISGSCTLTDLPKVRLTREEFAEKLPMLGTGQNKHFRTRYFFDTSERAQGIVRVGVFVPDLGQKLRNVVRKVRKDIERRQRNSFSKLLADGLFTVCILTVTERKAEQMRTALRDLPVNVRVEVIPGLRELITHRRTK